MASCGVCSKKIGVNQIKIKCEDCTRVFHGQCVKMSKVDIDTLVSESVTWRCEPCQSTRRKSMRLESQAAAGELSIEEVMKVLQEMRKEQAKIVADFNTSHEALYEMLEKNTTAVTAQTARIEDVLKKYEELVNENNLLKKKVSMLEGKVEEAEQYSRRNTIEIQGVPQESRQETQEQVIELVKKVGSGLGYEIDGSMIDACHRLKHRPDGTKPPGIVVKFVRRIDKEALMQKKRGKRDFSTRHMGMAMDSPVFINESLTRSRRILFAKAREVKRKNGFKFLWQRGGNIFLRKSEEDGVIAVTCQADLDKLQ